MRIAIVDNTALINFTRLKHFNIFDSLKLVFKQIHIPMEVKKEYECMLKYESDRAWVLERLRPDEGFYSLCTKFDSLNVAMYLTKKGIDAGEAEAAAQQKEIGANYVLSDDTTFKEAIKSIDPTIKVISTLHVIAMLDLNKFISNREKILKRLFERRRFTSSELRTAYMESSKELGISLSKKELGKKTSTKPFRGNKS